MYWEEKYNEKDCHQSGSLYRLRGTLRMLCGSGIQAAQRDHQRPHGREVVKT